MFASNCPRFRFCIPLFLSVLLCLPLQGRAQDLGIVAGLNYGSVEDVDFGDAETTYQERSGYHVGIYLDLGLGPFAVRPGVRYIEAGPLFNGLSDALRDDQGVGVAEGLDNFDVNMFVVPVDIRLELPFPLVQPYAFGGPEMRFASTSSASSDLADDLRQNELTGNLGVGAQITVPGIGVTLSPEARYTFGLTGLMGETINVAGRSFETAGAQKVNMFFLSLGLQF